MDKWEYCVLTGASSSTSGFSPNYPRLTYFSIKGTSEEVKLADKDAKSRPEGFRNATQAGYVAHIIAKLGLEGWEMVGCGYAGECTHSLYFKRPRQ